VALRVAGFSAGGAAAAVEVFFAFDLFEQWFSAVAFAALHDAHRAPLAGFHSFLPLRVNAAAGEVANARACEVDGGEDEPRQDAGGG